MRYNNMQHALIVEDIGETGKWLVRVLLISFPDGVQVDGHYWAARA